MNLPDHIEGWIVHYPGRGSRMQDAPIKNMANMVDELLQSIQPLLDKPFAFFGHSMGGLVLFELARQLQECQFREPNILFISACSAPQMRESFSSIHGLADSEFLEELVRINGIPPELLRVLDALKLFLPAVRADFELFETHHYIPGKTSFDFPIVAFGGLDDPLVRREQIKGWAVHTKRGFKSHYVPGDHFFMNTERDTLLELITKEMSSLA